MKKILYTVLSFVVCSNAIAQSTLSLNFHPKSNGQDLFLNQIAQDINGNDMTISAFNYYISNIHVIYDGGQDLDLSDTILLVKTDAGSFDMGQYDVPNIEQVNFSVGVPQDINHLDITLYPTGHFLSFQSPSMHWGWTSGYKFLLVDGRADDNGDGTPTKLFQLHDVGDANFKNFQLPTVATYTPNQTLIHINCNLEQWLYGANINTLGVQHGSTGINATTMNNVNDRAVFESPLTAEIAELSKVGDLFFIKKDSYIEINWKDISGASSYKLVDLSGKVIASEKTVKNTGKYQTSNLPSGGYIFNISDENGVTLNSIKVIN